MCLKSDETNIKWADNLRKQAKKKRKKTSALEPWSWSQNIELRLRFHKIKMIKVLLASGYGSATSGAEPPLLGWSRSREPEPPFWQAKKESLVVVTKHDFKAIYNGKYDPKKTCITNSLFRSSKLKNLVHGAGAAWSCLFLPGAGADPIWSESAPGPWTSGARAAQKSVGSATLPHPVW